MQCGVVTCDECRSVSGECVVRHDCSLHSLALFMYDISLLISVSTHATAEAESLLLKYI
jgi:hypothetical protein